MSKIKEYLQNREMLIMLLMKYNQAYYSMKNEISEGKDLLHSIEALKIFNPFLYSEHPDRFFIREEVVKINPNVETDAKFKTRVSLVYHVTHTEAVDNGNRNKREHSTLGFVTYDDLEDYEAWKERLRPQLIHLYAPNPA